MSRPRKIPALSRAELDRQMQFLRGLYGDRTLPKEPPAPAAEQPEPDAPPAPKDGQG